MAPTPSSLATTGTGDVYLYGMPEAPEWPSPMPVDAFLAWVEQQPDGAFELQHGVPVAMAPARVGHSRAKLRVAEALGASIAARGLPCEAIIDGPLIRVGNSNGYVPDVLVVCGETLDDEALRLDDALIVVEVVSPSSGRRDRGAKLAGYFGLGSLRHYLLVLTDRRAVIHHARDAAGRITTSIHRDGLVSLDPPGIGFEVAALFRPARPA